MIVSVDAYAKINLFLDIESLREDGYHNIISYMHSVTLHDTVSVEHLASDTWSISLCCEEPGVPCDESNLVYKAAELFPIRTGSLRISITKRIPMSAGLAGGSADAAATLVALNEIYGYPLSWEELKSLGNKLGADVPFCIEKGACIASGTGDVLKKTSPMPYYPIVIARMGEGMSTPYAYKSLDTKYEKFVNYSPNTDKLKVLTDGTDLSIEQYSSGFFNIFESIVEAERPYVTMLKKILMDNGAVASMMSGSGTAVFGLFKSKLDARKAENELASKGAFATVCYPYYKDE